MKRRVLATSFLFAALLLDPASSLRALAQPPERAIVAPQQQPITPEAAKRHESFAIVWRTVKDNFYDPTFGGVDWDEVLERYEPRVVKTRSDGELHLLLQEMLNELRQSHFLIIPKEAVPMILTGKDADESKGEDGETEDDEKDAAELLNSPNYRAAERLTYGIGIDLRVVDGTAIVTRVEQGSSAALAGLRPGFVIKEVDGQSLNVIIEQVVKHPIWKGIIGPEMPLLLLAGYINGAPQTPVELLYLDAQDQPRKVSVMREKLKGEMSPPVGHVPSVFTEFETKRLEGGIGYLRFNFFMPPVMEKVCAAIRSMRDAPGIVIDLRGNHGGLLAMIGGLSGLLETEAVKLGTLETRAGQNAFYVFPQKAPYTGHLMILVDGSTQSSAEMFAGGMQETGRAVVIGERSAGDTLPSIIKKLPTGALFQYGFANYRTPKGISLEGRGVVPDIEIKLSRTALLGHHDPQLDAAIDQIREQRARGRTIEGDPKASGASVPAAPPATRAAVSPAGATDELPPPPPRPLPTPTASSPEGALARQAAEQASLDGTNTIARILDRYVAAKGGRQALEKLTSRVSKGRMEMEAVGLSGSAELYEKAPNKSILIVNMSGLGIMQRGFDGHDGWWQDSLMGYIKLSGDGLTKARRDADFYGDIKLAELYPLLVFGGKEKVGEREAYVLWGGIAGAELDKLYFDVQTGLLLRKGNIYYEDYREVDGVKLPFTVREESLLGFGFVFKVTEVRHNVAIDDGKFVEFPNCFTRP
jgi:carboxyl-terminal processing protease